MQSNARSYIIVAVVLLALGGLWFIIRGAKPTTETAAPPNQVAKTSEDETKTQAEPKPANNSQAEIISGGGGIVRVRITENGQPSPGAYANLQVKATNESTAKEPDENGYIEFANIPAGNCRVYGGLRNPKVGLRERNQVKEIAVTEGNTTEVLFDFASGAASIVGTMAFDGQPPTRGWVQMTITGTDSSNQETFHVDVDSGGKFKIENLPPGQALLRAQGTMSESALVSRQQTVDLANGRATEVAFEMSGGGAINGTIAGLAANSIWGVGLARGSVSLPSRTTQEELMKLDRGEPVSASAVVDPPTGKFTFAGIEPGQYTICLTAMDESSDVVHCATAAVTVKEGETATVSLTLPN